MNYLIYLTCAAVLVQVATSQIISYGLQNHINPTSNLIPLNSANGINTYTANSANIATTGYNLNNLAANGIPNNLNVQAGNLQANKLQAGNVQTLYNGASAINNANIQSQIGVANVNRYPNVGIGNNFANFNGLNNPALARYSIANGVSLNSQQGPNSYGISVVAEELGVGGQLTVNGRMPFYGAVAVNTQLPTEGTANVNYYCGRPNL